jgi:hypothetical protein
MYSLEKPLFRIQYQRPPVKRGGKGGAEGGNISELQGLVKVEEWISE